MEIKTTFEDSAYLSVDVTGGPYDGQTLQIDLALLRQASDELMTVHNIEPNEQNEVSPTVEFLVDMAAKMTKAGFPCTPAIVQHAWLKMSEYFAEVQKKTNE